MRTRSVLTYGDIRSHLERVKMPDGFPVARFDDDEVLQRALLTHDDHQEVTLEGTAVETAPSTDLPAAPDAVLASDAEPLGQTATFTAQPNPDAANEKHGRLSSLTA
jgi:hypothetical protein